MSLIRRLEYQKQEILAIKTRKLVKREQMKKLEKWMNTDMIKVITGPRRSGKSFLAMMALPSSGYAYVNFDDDMLVSANMDEIIEGLKIVYVNFDTILMDEVQNRNKWELMLNAMKRMGYNIIVTGSNANLLSSELSTHLTGRYVEIKLFPFSYREFISAKGGKPDDASLINQYLFHGGFPEVVVKDYDSIEYLKTLFDSVVFKDIVKRYGIRKQAELLSLSRILLSNFSNIASMKKLAAGSGLSYPTIMKFLHYLEQAYLVILSRQFSFKQKEKERFTRFKTYAIDTGFYAGKSFGRRMENAVAVELCRRNHELMHVHGKNEIDFVVHDGNSLELIQVTADPENERELRFLVSYSPKFSGNVKRTVITYDYEDRKTVSWYGKSAEVEFVPLWKWLYSCP